MPDVKVLFPNLEKKHKVDRGKPYQKGLILSYDKLVKNLYNNELIFYSKDLVNVYNNRSLYHFFIIKNNKYGMIKELKIDFYRSYTHLQSSYDDIPHCVMWYDSLPLLIQNLKETDSFQPKFYNAEFTNFLNKYRYIRDESMISYKQNFQLQGEFYATY